jgi:hypothetical protein
MTKHARSGAVSVADKGVRVRQLRRDEGVAEAHRRFGGLDIPASLAGTLCALGLTVLLAGLLTGIGSIGYQTGMSDSDSTLSAGGLIGGLLGARYHRRADQVISRSRVGGISEEGVRVVPAPPDSSPAEARVHEPGLSR